MAATSTKPRRKSSGSKKKKRVVAELAPERSLLLEVVASLASGALLGLSAPGLDHWYLAWFGLVPWLLLVAGSAGVGQAFVRGLLFGFAYNLVYLNWYLGLHPLNWLGFNSAESLSIATLSWLLVALHQGVIIGAVSALCRALPITGGFLPQKVDERWCLPSLLVIPLLWVLVNNKLGNASDLLGVPWSMIEYSQYRQLPLIQISSYIGGIGLGFLIVLVNVAIAGFLATASAKLNWRSLAAPTTSASVCQLLMVLLTVTAVYASGALALSSSPAPAPQNMAVLQGNINIDMQKSRHRYTLKELLAHYETMARLVSSGLCLSTESALPTDLKHEPAAQQTLARIARDQHLDLIVGSIDYDDGRHPYNSAYGVSSSGMLNPSVYHKRYLVPFGEYMPAFVKYLPEWLQRLTNTPAGSGFAAGKAPTVLWLPSGKIAPLICFESLSPELVAGSVRNGGQLLVNLCDLAWFHDSIIGQQMLAFSIFRAVENHRFFVLAANSGPSAIINPQGKIMSVSQVGQTTVLKGKVGLSSDLTTFTSLFR